MRRQIGLRNHLTTNGLRIDRAVEGDAELAFASPDDAPRNRPDIAQVDLDRRPLRDRHLRLGEHPARRQVAHARSEEHTSELQSLMRNSYAVFCLKHKNRKHRDITVTSTTIYLHKQHLHINST